MAFSKVDPDDHSPFWSLPGNLRCLQGRVTCHTAAAGCLQQVWDGVPVLSPCSGVGRQLCPQPWLCGSSSCWLPFDYTWEVCESKAFWLCTWKYNVLSLYFFLETQKLVWNKPVALHKITDSERICWALSCCAAFNSELNCLVIQPGHAACLQFCWLSKLEEQGQVWSDVLIDCLGRGIWAQQLPKQGVLQGKIRGWIWAEEKATSGLFMCGVWDMGGTNEAMCIHEVPDCCSSCLGNNQWMQSQTVLDVRRAGLGMWLIKQLLLKLAFRVLKSKTACLGNQFVC